MIIPCEKTLKSNFNVYGGDNDYVDYYVNTEIMKDNIWDAECSFSLLMGIPMIVSNIILPSESIETSIYELRPADPNDIEFSLRARNEIQVFHFELFDLKRLSMLDDSVKKHLIFIENQELKELKDLKDLI
jgi:hypothetical protein